MNESTRANGMMRYKDTLIAALFCAVLMLPAVVWLSLNSRVWPWDSAEYGSLSIDLWRTLWDNPKLWPWMFFHAVGIKAPGMIWLAQIFIPLRHFFGGVDGVFFFMIVISQWCCLILNWIILRKITGQTLLAYTMTLFLASLPYFANMSHFVLMEPMQLASIFIFWLIAVYARDLTALGIMGLLLWASGLALGFKISAPIYCFVPGLYSLCMIGIKLRERQWGLSLKNGVLALSGLGYLAVVAMWYVLNLEKISGLVSDAALGEAAIQWGYRGTFIGKFVYWIRLLVLSCMGLSAWPYQLVAAIFIVLLTYSLFRRRKQSNGLALNGNVMILCLLSAVQVFCTLCFLSFITATTIRFIIAILPSIMVFLGVLLCGMSKRWGKQIVFASSGCLYVVTSLLSFGFVVPGTSSVRSSMIAPDSSRARLDQVEHLVEMVNVPEYHGVYHLCGVDFDWLSGSTLNYYAAKQSLDTGVRCYFGRLGSIFNPTLTGAWARVHGELGYYIVANRRIMNERADLYGDICRQIRGRIDHDPRFELQKDDALPSIDLYRNITFGKRSLSKEGHFSYEGRN